MPPIARTLLVAFLLAGTLLADDAERDTATRHVLVLGSRRPWVAELRIEVDGRSHREHWEAWLDERFAEYDANDNGHLDGDEVGRVIRASTRAPSNTIFDFFRRGKAAVTGDGDGDGMISPAELAAYHRTRREGAFRVEEQDGGNGIDVDALSSKLLLALDTDDDGRLSRAELESAPESAARLDRNDDELVVGTEVAIGNQNQFVLSPDEVEIPAAADDVVDLPTDSAAIDALVRRIRVRYRGEKSTMPGLAAWELQWSNPDRFRRFDTDENGRIEDAELAAFLRNPVADLRITVRFRNRRWWTSPPKDGSDWSVEALQGMQKKPMRVQTVYGRRFRVVTGGDMVEFLPPVSTNATERNLIASYEGQFATADSDNNEYLEREECDRYFYFLGLFEKLDADDDGKVFKDELRAFLKAQMASARSRTRMIVADRGRNLFDLVDSNRNGTITPRELSTTAVRAANWDRDDDGTLAADEVPRFLRVSVQPGRPSFRNVQYLIGQGGGVAYNRGQVRYSKDAPAWFRGMDRNRDGDVSRREWLGPLADFDRLDADANNLISPAEARE